MKYRAFPLRNKENFETWVINRFGKELYEIFFKSYSEKLWGIKCDKLDIDFASQRIKKLSEKSFMLSFEEEGVPKSFWKRDILDLVFYKESFS
jgi:protoporphyrinogen oxidase